MQIEEDTTVVLTAFRESARFIGSVLKQLVDMMGNIYLFGHINLLVFFIACSVILLIEDTIFLAYNADWVFDDDVDWKNY